MKNLALSNYGVEEMNHADTINTDGGILPWLIAGAIVWMASSCNGNNTTVQNGIGNSNSSTHDGDNKSDSTSVEGHVHLK